MVLKDLLKRIDSPGVTIHFKELTITIVGYVTEEKIQSIPDEIVNREVDLIKIGVFGVVDINIR